MSIIIYFKVGIDLNIYSVENDIVRCLVTHNQPPLNSRYLSLYYTVFGCCCGCCWNSCTNDINIFVSISCPFWRRYLTFCIFMALISCLCLYAKFQHTIPAHSRICHPVFPVHIFTIFMHSNRLCCEWVCVCMCTSAWKHRKFAVSLSSEREENEREEIEEKQMISATQ